MFIRIENLALRRGPNLLFSGATLQAHPGDRLGVTGVNGSGKSSLLALIRGQLEADEGELRIPPDAVIAHVEQSAPSGDAPALEYVIDGDEAFRRVQQALEAAQAREDNGQLVDLHEEFERLDGYTAEARAGRLLHGLGFGDDEHRKPVSEFSGGWRVRLNLARALMCRSDILLLDEPTNHLDLPAILWLEGWLREYRGIALIISHDRDFMDAVCTHIAHIEHQRVDGYTGNYSRFEHTRAEQLAQQQALHEKQQREIRHVRGFVDRFRAKASKARQAQSRLKMLERMEQIAPAHVDSPFNFSFLEPQKQPQHLLQLEKAGAGYDGDTVLSGVDLNISAGARVGLLGVNGAGKSTLVKTLADGSTLLAGKRTVHRDCRIGYFAQHQLELLDAGASPMTHLLRRAPGISEQQARDFLGGFGFRGERIFEPVEPFSGGEKARLVLALIVNDRPNLLLLDEPTNHLDLEMRHALTVALQDFTGALVVISHDRHLLRSVCDDLYLVHGGRCELYREDLDDYARWVGQNNPSRNGPATPRARSNNRRDRRRLEAERRQALKPQRERVRAIEKRLNDVQAELAKVDARMSDEALYTDAARKDEMMELLKSQAALKSECETLEEAWLEAGQELERAAEL